jgi:hypothetical protein
LLAQDEKKESSCCCIGKTFTFNAHVELTIIADNEIITIQLIGAGRNSPLVSRRAKRLATESGGDKTAVSKTLYQHEFRHVQCTH